MTPQERYDLHRHYCRRNRQYCATCLRLRAEMEEEEPTEPHPPLQAEERKE